jgi:hypothetical protein
MATAVAGAGAPPPPPGGPLPPGPSGSLSSGLYCSRHPGRKLSTEDVAAGYTRCPECREKGRQVKANSRVCNITV